MLDTVWWLVLGALAALALERLPRLIRRLPRQCQAYESGGARCERWPLHLGRHKCPKAIGAYMRMRGFDKKAS